MHPHDLVNALLKRQGLSPYAAAKAMHKPSFQPTLHKFLHGQIAEPTHGTAKRIADFLKLPIEAIYDASVATRLARELGIQGPAAADPVAKAGAVSEPVSIYAAKRNNQLSPDTLARIAALPAKQFKALANLVTVYLDSVAPAAADEPGKQAQG